MATNNKSAITLRCGNIRATIWQNNSERVRSSRRPSPAHFKDQSGMWHNRTSFGLKDLEDMVTVARAAKKWISDHALKQ